MNINKLADKARRSISKYCIEECKAYCCRKGFIILKEIELTPTLNKKRQELINSGMLKKIKPKDINTLTHFINIFIGHLRRFLVCG